MIKIENGKSHIEGHGIEVLRDLSTLLVTIATNEDLNNLMEDAALIAQKIIEEDTYVPHNSSNKS